MYFFSRNFEFSKNRPLDPGFFIPLSLKANHWKTLDANAKCFLWDNLVGQNSLCSTYWTQWNTYLSWLFYIRLCILVVHVWMCTYYKNGLQNSSQWHDTWKGVISYREEGKPQLSSSISPLLKYISVSHSNRCIVSLVITISALLLPLSLLGRFCLEKKAKGVNL